MKNESKISFKVTDNLSGINEFNGFVDGKWVLFQYDGKNKHIFYKSDVFSIIVFAALYALPK